MRSILSLGPLLVPITAIVIGGIIALVVIVQKHQNGPKE